MIHVSILSSDIPSLIRAVWYVAFAFSFSAYAVAMHGRFGQTLGKMATGVKVLDLSEARLSWEQAILREVVPIALIAVSVAIQVPSVLRNENLLQAAGVGAVAWLQFAASFGWFAAEVLTMMANAKRRAVHDFIAGSVVVRIRKPAIRESRGVVAV